MLIYIKCLVVLTHVLRRKMKKVLCFFFVFVIFSSFCLKESNAANDTEATVAANATEITTKASGNVTEAARSSKVGRKGKKKDKDACAFNCPNLCILRGKKFGRCRKGKCLCTRKH